MRATLLSLGLAAALAACSDSATAPAPSPGPAAGRFTLRTTGAVTADTAGDARLGTAGGLLHLSLEAPGEFGVVLVGRAIQAPAAGSYAVVPTADPDGGAVFAGVLTGAGAAGTVRELRGGTLRITRVSATEVEGTLEVRARGSDGLDVFVTAAFRAARAGANASPVGTYVALGASDAAPLRIFDGTIAATPAFRLRVDVLGGTHVVTSDGRYETRLRLQTTVDQELPIAFTWYDRGAWRAEGAGVVFESSYIQNQVFEAAVAGPAMLLSEDFVGAQRNLTLPLVRQPAP